MQQSCCISTCLTRSDRLDGLSIAWGGAGRRWVAGLGWSGGGAGRYCWCSKEWEVCGAEFNSF